MPLLYTRRELYAAADGRCCWCGAETWLPERGDDGRGPKLMATVEHIIPRSAGGTSDRANLSLACAGCNNSRHSPGTPTAPPRPRRNWRKERPPFQAALPMNPPPFDGDTLRLETIRAIYYRAQYRKPAPPAM